MRIRVTRAVAIVALLLMLPAAGAAPAAAKTHRVGMLWYGRPLEARTPVLDTFRRALAEQGFVEGQNLVLEQPTRFHLTVNARTAKSLRVTLPPTLLLRADEVIE